METPQGRAERGGSLLPGCGASRVGRSPTPDRPSLPRAAGARYPLAVGWGGVGVGTRHRPHSARPCELALRAVDAAPWRPGAGAFCLGVACPGWGALPRPTAYPWGVRPGPATHLLWVRGVWASEPVSNPTARALASWLCALWMRHEDARGGGGASCLGVARLGSGALPRPTAHPWGVRPGPATHWLRVRGPVGPGTRQQPHSTRPCKLPLRAVDAARGRPEAGAFCLAVARQESGALQHPTAYPWGVQPGPATHSLWMRGVWAWGPVSKPKARSWELALCAVEAQRGYQPGGGVCCQAVGRPGLDALPYPTARPAVAQGWIQDETTRGSVNIQEAVDRVAHTDQTEVALHIRGRHGGPAEKIVMQPTGMVLVLAADMVRGVLQASRLRRARPQWIIQAYTLPRAWPFSTWVVLAVMWHQAPQGTPTGNAEEIARDHHAWSADHDFPWRRPQGGLPVAPAAEGFSLPATLQRQPDRRACPFLQTGYGPGRPARLRMEVGCRGAATAAGPTDTATLKLAHRRPGPCHQSFQTDLPAAPAPRCSPAP